MRIIDLTHMIEPGMPVFPGTEPPRLEDANTVAVDGFAEKKLFMVSHTGTHMDAPAHMLAGGRTLDAYDAADFFGPAVMIDVPDRMAYVPAEALRPVEHLLSRARFLVLRTGWSRYWGRDGYFQGFPALSREAAGRVAELGVKGVGIDAISIDRMEDADFPVHKILFGAGLFVIENLAGLNRLGPAYRLAAFPLRIKDSDGSPARVVAFTDEP